MMKTACRNDWKTHLRPESVVRRLWQVVVMLVVATQLLGVVANGQVSDFESPELGEPIQPQALADGSYADRQRATLEMWRRRSTSRQSVQDAARNSDPEVAERAEWILRQWRNGTLPGTIRGSIGSLMQT
ncbi:MAG: hypothetical protein AAFU85_34295, partial [Planctomycetota bacterium]